MSSEPMPAAVRRATVADARAAATLHTERIAEGFLVTLGPQFLRLLYRRIVRSPKAFLLVAGEPGEIYGFVAVADNTGALYREFLLRDGFTAGLTSVPALLRAPRKVLETLRYGFGGDDLPDAEILAMAVSRQGSGRGIGRALASAALAELSSRGVEAAQVVTASGNEPALHTYRRVGFHEVRSAEVHSGVAQKVLVWP